MCRKIVDLLTKTTYLNKWPKCLQKFPKQCLQQFLHEVIFFKIALKSPILLGYFCKQICCQEVSKLAKSGHTEQKLINCFLILSRWHFFKRRQNICPKKRNSKGLGRLIDRSKSIFCLPRLIQCCVHQIGAMLGILRLMQC